MNLREPIFGPQSQRVVKWEEISLDRSGRLGRIAILECGHVVTFETCFFPAAVACFECERERGASGATRLPASPPAQQPVEGLPEDRKAVAWWLFREGFVWSSYDRKVRKPSKDLRTLEDCLKYLGVTFFEALTRADEAVEARREKAKR